MNKKENEIDLMLECASKVKGHLSRVLEQKSEIALRMKMHYVDSIIDEADAIKKDLNSYS
ncbi:MAG: hypothetical protein AAF616_10840 [Bacteroidota bacterium]